jgi:GxxExxY protein
MNRKLTAEMQRAQRNAEKNLQDSSPKSAIVSSLHENEISSLIIGAAIEVHRYHGPGLVEQVYEESLCHEFHLRNIPFRRQEAVPIYYKGVRLGSNLYLDLLVHVKVIVDNKAKDEILPIDKIKLRTYLRLSNLRLGLIINFHSMVLKDGIVRVVNDLAEYEPPPPVSFQL